MTKNIRKYKKKFIHDFRPPILTRKKGHNQKAKTDVHNDNVCSIQIRFNYFSNFRTSRGFVRKQKPIKTHQRAITRDRKHISYFCL